jgi:integrase
MPTPLKGNARLRRGKWSARVTLRGRDKRLTLALPTCREEDAEKAAQRAELLASTALRLVAADVSNEKTEEWLEKVAGRDGTSLEHVLTAIERVCAGDAAPPMSAATTFREFGEQWTGGTLHTRWPDHVKRKSTSATDAVRLAKHVYPYVGEVPLPEFRLAHAELVMSSLPRDLTSASRRHVAQCMARILKLAVYPAGLLRATPIPAGFLPSVGQRKALTFLYPDEDRALLACAKVPLAHRMLYGFLCREGMRKSEAASLTWADVDLERGAVKLDENKTDDPRAWALDPGVVRALVAWRELRRPKKPSAPVFVDDEGVSVAAPPDGREVARLRAHLKLAEVARGELFERSEVRQPLRMHDLRATFVTISLANGKSETWVADRTGHASSAMINRYRRAARTVAELGLGELLALDQAVPELRSGPSKGPDQDRDPGPDQALSGPPEGANSAVQVSSTSDFAIRDDGLQRIFGRVGHGGLEPPANGLRVHCSTT